MALNNLQWLICHNNNIQIDHQVPYRRQDLAVINKKITTCHHVDFAVPLDHRVKVKENEKTDKYLDLAREQKKLWIMRVMVIPIVVSVLGMVPKGLEDRLDELEIRGRIETLQTTARILRIVLET